MDWNAYFAAAGLDAQPEFVAWQASAVTGLSALVASEPLDVWKDYLAFHAAEHFSAVLPQAFRDERFAFHGKVMAGIQEQRERSKLAIDATERCPGRGGGPPLRREVLPPRVQGQHRVDGRQPDRRVRPAHRRARLDGA